MHYEIDNNCSSNKSESNREKSDLTPLVIEHKVLVIDDNPSDFELVSIYLKPLKNVKLDYVKNLEEVKNVLVDSNYSVILCDYDLGSITGLEIFEYLQEKGSEAPFIIMSGAQGEDRAVEILRLGIIDYVLKDKLDKIQFIIQRAINDSDAKKHETKTLELLKNSEKSLREIFNSIVDVYFHSDIEGVQLVLSPSVEKIIGFKPEELIGTNVCDIYANPNDRKKYIKTILEKGSITDYEVSIICKDGTNKEISVNAELIFNDNKEPVGTRGVYRDISDKKRQQRILVKREAQLRESQQMASLGSWELNSETKKIVLSPEFFRIFELPYDDKERSDFYEFSSLVHADDRSRLESNFLKFIKSGNQLPYEFRIITPSGKLKYVSTKVFKHNKGDSDFLSGIIQDITDLKLLEEEKNNVQRQALEMLEEMVEQRTKKIEEQRAVIEQKNRDITDSIRYAKQVQMAILPSKELIDQFLPQNFIIYYPKDIVAGDFYWSFTIGEYFMIAVADCTGHGVPGALVSMICYNALNRAVNQYALREPGKILDKVNRLVVEFFSHGSGEVKDGMDISLLVFNFNKKEIMWSGANNPLVYFDSQGMNKINADKQAIGNQYAVTNFTTHYPLYQKDASFYLFSDGYADQFGGDSNKKFMQKRFYALMELVHKKSTSKQEDLFAKTFQDWKRDYEQVDDVAIIGFKLP
ncbi:MAG: PAS domain S-box-containing protein [Psychromonas sp.]|jgi:PAS domain S-box-containing protein